jgi:O-antigen/teichoic acid export membrane protein
MKDSARTGSAAGVAGSRLSIAAYVALMGGAAALAAAKYALFATRLPPEEFGIYSLVLTTYVFVLYAGSLGANEGVLKLVGLAHGRGQPEETRAILGSAIIYAGVSTSIVGGLFALGVRLRVSEPRLAEALSLVGVLAVSTLCFNLYDGFLRSTQRFLAFAMLVFTKAVAVVAIGWYVAGLFGAVGLIWTEVGACIGLIAISLGAGDSWRGLRDLGDGWRIFKDVVGNGFPRLAAMLVGVLAVSLDRWAVAGSLGLEAAGRYAFAMLVHPVALTSVGLVMSIYGPKWLAMFAATRDVHALLRSARSVSLLLGLGAGALFLAGYLSVPTLIGRFYPQYGGSDLLWALAWIACGTVVLVCTAPFEWIFVATSNEGDLLRAAVVTLCVTTILLGLAYWARVGIQAYAAVFLVGRLVNGAWYWGALKGLEPRWRASEVMRPNWEQQSRA